MAAIKTISLTKTYIVTGKRPNKVALHPLDLTVEKGQIYGFLGPNGAGKTTTIKSLLGFIRPTAGEAYLFGIPADDPDARRPVGYLPEQPYFHKFMTPTEVIKAHAALAGVPRKERREAVAHALELVGLEEHARLPISKLSKGLTQRVGIGQALVGNPKLLILDEPTSGLDPIGRRKVRDLLTELKAQGKTIFLSSHMLSEIEHLCDRIGILSHGKLVAEGTPGEIKAQDPMISVRTGDLTPEAADAFSMLGASVERWEGETAILVPPEQVFAAIRILEQHNLPLISAVSHNETLEDAFMRLAA